MRGSGESAVRGSMEQHGGMTPGVGFVQLRPGFKVRVSNLHSLLKPNGQQPWPSPSWMYFRRNTSLRQRWPSPVLGPLCGGGVYLSKRKTTRERGFPYIRFYLGQLSPSFLSDTSHGWLRRHGDGSYSYRTIGLLISGFMLNLLNKFCLTGINSLLVYCVLFQIPGIITFTRKMCIAYRSLN